MYINVLNDLIIMAYKALFEIKRALITHIAGLWVEVRRRVRRIIAGAFAPVTGLGASLVGSIMQDLIEPRSMAPTGFDYL